MLEIEIEIEIEMFEMLEIFCHIVLFSCIFTIILNMSCFSVYFPHFFPTYAQHLPDLRSKFVKLIDISIFLKGSCFPRPPPYASLYPLPLLPASYAYPYVRIRVIMPGSVISVSIVQFYLCGI